jgi:RNA polymerase sigma-70 factor (ECF subfamily)
MNQKKEQKLQILLTEAHHEYEKRLNQYAFFKLHNHQTGEDAVQNTFMKTWKYLVKGGKIVLMKAFLYHILNDLIIDEYRKHKEVSLENVPEKDFEQDINQPDIVLNNIDVKSAILLIQNLPEKLQKIMRMRYIQGLSLKEMSLILGQSRNTVAVQAHRGLKKLKQLYKKGEVVTISNKKS